MQSSAFDAGSLILSFVPAVFLIGALVLVYFRGKHVNAQIMKKTFIKLEEVFNDVIEDYNLSNSGPANQTYLPTLTKKIADTKDDNINNYVRNIQRMRLHFSTEDRHMLFSWVFLLFKKSKDFAILEADSAPQKNEYLNLEVVRYKDLGKYQLEKFQKEFTDLEDFELASEFSKTFIHKTNHPNALRYLYNDDPLIKKLMYNLPGLHRVSVKRNEDYSVRIVVQITKSFDASLCKQLFLRLMKAVSDTNIKIKQEPKRLLKV